MPECPLLRPKSSAGTRGTCRPAAASSLKVLIGSGCAMAASGDLTYCLVLAGDKPKPISGWVVESAAEEVVTPLLLEYLRISRTKVRLRPVTGSKEEMSVISGYVEALHKLQKRVKESQGRGHGEEDGDEQPSSSSKK